MERLLELRDITLIPNQKTYKAGNLEGMDFWEKDSLDSDQRYSTTLPIFTSPMSAIIDSGNWETWLGAGIKTIIPRTESLETRIQLCQYTFSAFSLQEVKEEFLMKDRRNCPGQLRISIDVGAAGHDNEMFEVALRLRSMYMKQVIIMGGNIGNPATFSEEYFNTFDYVRIGISSGSLVNKDFYGYHYPMASFLMSIKKIREFKKSNGPKVIVDGGISGYTDIVKALALGADYVMIGREFAKLFEAAGPIYLKKKDGKTGKDTVEEVIDRSCGLGPNMYRLYYGNTSLESQALRAGYAEVSSWKGVPKASDTKREWVKVNNTLLSWLTELKSHFQYSFLMSDSSRWIEFKRKVIIGRI